MKRQPLWLSVLAGLTLASLVAAAPAPDKRAADLVPITGGFVDVAGQIAYVRTSAVSVSAIDLKSGEVLWQSKDAFLPLGMQGGRVVALGTPGQKGLGVVILDAKEGKTLFISEALPAGVWLEGPTQGSEVRGTVEDGAFVVRWHSVARPFSGVPHPPGYRTTYDGEAKVDPETGKVKVVKSEMVPPDKQPKTMDAAPEPDQKLPEAIVKDLQAYEKQGYWPRGANNKPRPLIVGDRCGLVVYEPVKSGTKLVWKTWDRTSGKADDAKTLAEGKNVYVLSAQGATLFVLDQSDPKNVATLVLSLETGEQLARLTSDYARAPVLVQGNRLYNIGGMGEKSTLEAVDLTTGKLAWSRTIFRYVYNGPYPP